MCGQRVGVFTRCWLCSLEKFTSNHRVHSCGRSNWWAATPPCRSTASHGNSIQERSLSRTEDRLRWWPWTSEHLPAIHARCCLPFRQQVYGKVVFVLRQWQEVFVSWRSASAKSLLHVQTDLSDVRFKAERGSVDGVVFSSSHYVLGENKWRTARCNKVTIVIDWGV